MATGAGIEGVGGPIRRLFGDGSVSGMDAGELLRRFAVARDPLALEVLVARHGPMVLGVCRRVLGDRHASDDAFQATFLLLAKKAGAIRDPDRLGPWLHGVAHRVAVRARADLARRKARERPGAEELAMATPADEAGFDRLELRAALDEEIRRLPEKFRDPIVLCYLDGLTHDEAATRLRCPVGTVRSRLSTGRAKLRERLARRGVAVPSGALAAAVSAEAAPAVVSPVLLSSTVKAATAFAAGLAGATAAGVVPAAVASLAEGVSTTMILSKLKVVAGCALAGLMTVGVGGVAAYQAGDSGQEPQAEKVEKPAADPPLVDQLNKAASDIKQLQEQRDRIRAELEAAQKRLETLLHPKGLPKQPELGFKEPFESQMENRVKQAEAQTATAKASLEQALSELKEAKARLAKVPEGLGGMGGMMPGAPPSGGGPGMPGAPAGGMPGAASGMGAMMGSMGGGMATRGGTDARGKGEVAGGRGGMGSMPGMGGGMSMGMGGGTGSGGGMGFGGGMGMGGGMGFGGGMGGVGRNGPDRGPASPLALATFQSTDYVIVHKPKTDRVAGYGTEAGEWAYYEIPKGVDVVPICVPGVSALKMTGDQIGQVAAYAPAAGRWFPVDLKEPAKGDATPIIGPGLAVYAIGRRVYAFGIPAKSWDVLELPEGANPAPIIQLNRVTVEHDDHLYIYSPKTGKWAGLDAGAGRPAAPAAK